MDCTDPGDEGAVEGVLALVLVLPRRHQLTPVPFQDALDRSDLQSPRKKNEKQLH